MRQDEKIFRALVIGCCAVALLVLVYCGINCFGCSACDDDDKNPSQSDVVKPNTPSTVRVTFPEGINIMRYGELLEENGVCTAQEFFDTMNSTDFSEEFDFLPPFSKLSQRPYTLEGYLYPDTYDFYVDEDPVSVIKRFLRNFDNRVTDEMRAAVAQVSDFYGKEFTLDDIIIMASIVEKEISAVPSEMDGVAAVFYNRIKYPNGKGEGTATGGKLQSDATKYYPYTIHTKPDGFNSEYNTYDVVGLPKGPVCCPSLNAIKGSMYPDTEQNSFFFLTDKNYDVYYAVTYKKHRENIKYCEDNGLASW